MIGVRGTRLQARALPHPSLPPTAHPPPQPPLVVCHIAFEATIPKATALCVYKPTVIVSAVIMAKLLSRFGSKKDLSNQELKCAIRLLDDEEVLQTSFEVDSNISGFVVHIGY